jgi:phosphocarrier protein
MSARTAETTSIPIADPLGLHARPSVKLSKLAKTFRSRIELAKAPEGPWVDAKSVSKVMGARAPRDTRLYIRAEGEDAAAAVAAIAELVERNFDQDASSAAAG